MKKLPILMCLLFPVALSAAEMNTQALQACSLIENDWQRLQCFDQVVAGKSVTQMKQSVQVENEIPVSTSSKEPIENSDTQANNFGLEHKLTAESGDQISAIVTDVKNKPRGELIIYLDNGHVWNQIGSDRFKVSVGESVTIKRGVFNSFVMKVDGRNRGIKVKR